MENHLRKLLLVQHGRLNILEIDYLKANISLSGENFDPIKAFCNI